MIVNVKEYNYMGFLLQHVEGKGWKITLGDFEYLFPHAQAAQTAIHHLHEVLVQEHNAVKTKIKAC